MDNELDFIRPEFLNILFFEQKNLVIFPRVDIKHLHGLEIFTTGYNIIDLDSTALHNLKGILEFESNNTYSQNPTLYFITDVEKKKINEIMDLDGIHCIINSIENVSEMVNGGVFIFFNKKTNQFLNYDTPDSKLDFEQHLISTSENKMVLQEKIQKIKFTATRIFTELNQVGNLNNLSQILEDYDPKYWNSILQFTSTYYDVNMPNVPTPEVRPTPPARSQQNLKDYSREYETILSSNKAIAKEFIQLLHEYRSKKVNPAHLELEELYNPQLLYNYLRNRHWKDGIPRNFIQDWINMEISGYELTESDRADFNEILAKLGLSEDMPTIIPSQKVNSRIKNHANTFITIPSVRNDQKKFEQWLFIHLEEISQLVLNLSRSELNSILSDLSELNDLLKINNKIQDPSIAKRHEKDTSLLIVDITNILHLDKDNEGNLKVENILKIGNTICSLGFTPEMIADASMRHYVNDPSAYENLIRQGKIIQAPAGKEADEFILKIAKSEGCKFLSNDLYRDYKADYDENWIFNNRLTCVFHRDEFIIA